MKESKECAKTAPPPKPNLKNKDFVKWSKAEPFRKEDNIISTDWHEKLQKTSRFNPVYDNAPVNMVYLMSGEYGRIWQREREEWYGSVFVPQGKEKDWDDRKKKIRKEIRQQKKAAEIKIKERKERKAKEAELTAKAEAEKAEKLKAKMQQQQNAAKIKPKKRKETPPKPPTPPEKEDGCPKGWKAVELTMQCECSDHKKEEGTTEATKEQVETTRQAKPDCNSSRICEGYCEELREVQKAKANELLQTAKG